MAKTDMFFPFLTCEVRCDVTALQVADRQNAHRMTLAVGVIVGLLRGLECEAEVHWHVASPSRTISFHYASTVITWIWQGQTGSTIATGFESLTSPD